MMKTTISYSEARALLDKHIQGTAMRHHSTGTAVAMRAIAKALGQNEEFFAIAGLLHDLDMESIGNDLSKHGIRTIELLREEGYDIPELFAPILAHTEVLEGSPYRRESLIDYTLAGIENLVGFISAYVVLRPSRTVVGAEPSSINRKLKDKSFANNVNRETISNAVEHSKLDRAEFIRLVIDALSTNAKEIGM